MTQLIKLPDVLERTLLSRGTVYALLKKGEFPRPIKLSERINAWRESDIEDWIEARRSDA